MGEGMSISYRVTTSDRECDMTSAGTELAREGRTALPVAGLGRVCLLSMLLVVMTGCQAQLR